MTENEIIYKSGNELSEEQLYIIAKIDNKIPLEFNSNHEVNQEQTLERVKYYKELLDNSFFEIAFLNEDPVAFHALQKRGSKSANIATLWVHPSYRKQGLAKNLKRRGIEWARKEKLECITTSVHTTNERMVEINQDAGFEVLSVNMKLKL